MFDRADRYTRAELAGVVIPPELRELIAQCERITGHRVDIEGMVIRLLEDEQRQTRRGELDRLLADLRPSEAKESRDMPRWSEESLRRAERDASEQRRATLRRRLAPRRETRKRRPRRRVCQLSNAWMVAQ